MLAKTLGVALISVVLAANVTLWSAIAEAREPVALELVLAVDASSSVDAAEYALQVAGYVAAFRDPEVIAAIEALAPKGLAVTYVEWSSRFRQVQSVGWTHIAGAADAHAFADAISQNANQLEASGTALGEAVLYCVELVTRNEIQSDRKVVDVSADDRYNAGSSPAYAQGVALRNGVTVNGLAIDPTGKLTDYFRQNVIVGADAFVVQANSFDDFAAALKRKLLRELGERPIAAMPH